MKHALTIGLLLCLFAPEPSHADPLTLVVAALTAAGVPVAAANIIGAGVVTPLVVPRERRK